MIAIASTCLSETIGEDVPKLISEYKIINEDSPEVPEMIFASTPSYNGTHAEGFFNAILAAVKTLAESGEKTGEHINLFSSLISPEDIRHLKEILEDFGIQAMVFPDYSDTLDNTSWDTYTRIPDGGTPISALKASGSAAVSVELGFIKNAGGMNGKIKDNYLVQSAGNFLKNKFDVPCIETGLPVGINETDKFFNILSSVSGRPVPEKYSRQRGRLVDLYIDGHKYVSGKRAVVYGEEDLVVAWAAFLSEIGIKPVLCATGGESGKLRETLQKVLGPMYEDEIIIGQGMSFERMDELMQELKPDLMIGNSKGYYIARKMDIPIIRCGFPIHDRIGAQHARMLGYEGTTIFFEQVANALLEEKQRKSPVGYKYM